MCLSNNFAIQPEILYSAQGFKYKEGDFTTELQLDYLNIPIMAKFKLTDELIIEAGPQIGFLLLANEVFESPGNSGDNDVKEEYKNIDFGANIGLVYQFEGGLNFGARYNLGLSNINDFEGSGSFKNQNGVFQFSIGFRF